MPSCSAKICHTACHRRMAQRLPDLLHQQAVTPILQNRQRQGALQHLLQGFFITAQGQGQIPGVEPDFSLRCIELQ